jgi:hypothetical protein
MLRRSSSTASAIRTEGLGTEGLGTGEAVPLVSPNVGIALGREFESEWKELGRKLEEDRKRQDFLARERQKMLEIGQRCVHGRRARAHMCRAHVDDTRAHAILRSSDPVPLTRPCRPRP